MTELIIKSINEVTARDLAILERLGFNAEIHNKPSDKIKRVEFYRGENYEINL